MSDSVKNKKPESSPDKEIIVLALYKFVQLPDYVELRESVLDLCLQNNLFGTILLAQEGINGTVAGSRTAIDNFLVFLSEDGRFNDIESKESRSREVPFLRMKVKLKKEIVSMGINSLRPDRLTGTRVEPEDWNELISDPEVVLIDTRNQYEVDIGKFSKALSPQTETFRTFPDYVEKNLDPDKQKKVAMYCTGGIRCEKASAYLLEQGFEKVYQLNGGILNYLEKVEADNSLWQGECFVFDGRVSVNQKLEAGGFTQCYACRRPLSQEQTRSDEYVEGVSCPYCINSVSGKKLNALKERQKQVELAAARQEIHIGAKHEKN